MQTNPDTQDWRDTSERLFKNTSVSVGWVAFLAVFLNFVSWPIRNACLVCWVYGRHAYFRDGVRVLRGKPIRFTNGELAPLVPDLVTGFGAFIITAFCLTTLLILLVSL